MYPNEKIYLGEVKEDFSNDVGLCGQKIYITHHKWDCGWYWSCGYIGNRSLHTHFDMTFLMGHYDYVDQLFEKPRYTRDQWWQIRDLFIQAYALKEAANVYVFGGHQTSSAFRFSYGKKMANVLNKDCEIVLNKVWEILQNPIYSVSSDKDGYVFA